MRSVPKLLETMPDFGYDTAKVIPWVMSFEVKKTPATDGSKAKRDEMTAARNAEIVRLSEEGLSGRKIGEAVGCSEGAIRKILSAYNDRAGQSTHEHDEDYPEILPVDPEKLKHAHNPATDRELAKTRREEETISQARAVSQAIHEDETLSDTIRLNKEQADQAAPASARLYDSRCGIDAFLKQLRDADFMLAEITDEEMTASFIEEAAATLEGLLSQL